MSEPARNRSVFLDLNGTLVLPLKPETLDELKLIPGADGAVRRLLDAGFLCPVVTVQARIEKGYFTETEFRAWFDRFFGDLGLDVRGPYVCPHRYRNPCSCRKPNLLLYERAAEELSLDLARSYVLGDSPEDVQAARRFGGTGCLVRTGWAADSHVMEKAAESATFVAASMTEAADWILRRERGPPAHEPVVGPP